MDNNELWGGMPHRQADRAGHERSRSTASSPVGDHPLRERVRVILDCDWCDLQHALDMIIDAKPAFDSQPTDRPGWGWHWSRRGQPRLFVRRTKHGYSATALRDSDGSGEAGETAKTGSTEGDSAGSKSIAPPLASS